MNSAEKIKDFLKSFLIWFLIFYVLLMGYNFFFGQDKNVAEKEGNVIVAPFDDEPVLGQLARFTVQNEWNEKITFASPCEEPGSLEVARLINGQAVPISDFAECEKRNVNGFSLEPGESWTFSLRDFNADLFSEEGKYQISMQFEHGDGEVLDVVSQSLTFEKPGMIRQLFRAIISKPLFNLLVWLTDVLPGHSFGWAIVLTTLLVRALLFLPNQKAMRSQRSLQKLQPKIEELKQKHGKNQQVLAMKTMELYKTHKINPMSSCLPMLLQLPVLLGIYYIIQDGLSEHLRYLLYSFYENVDLSLVNPEFFGLDLNVPNIYVLPIIVGVAQWIAIKMSLVSAKKRSGDKKPAEGMMGQMQQMNTFMQWGMPIMITVFAATMPAGVSIYWLTSTLFGIGQQKIVNHQLDQPQVVRKGE